MFEALYVLLRKKPYYKISVTEIAQEANLSRHTFYSHYFSKDEILLKKIEQIFSKIDYKAMKELTLSNIVSMFIQIFEKNREFMLLLKNNGLSWMICKYLGDKIEEIIFNFNCPDLPKMLISNDGAREIYKIITINSLVKSMITGNRPDRISREYTSDLTSFQGKPRFHSSSNPLNQTKPLCSCLVCKLSCAVCLY